MNAAFNFFRACKARLGSRLSKAVDTAFNDKYLLYTNVSISICLSGLGDTLQQHYEILTDELDHWDKNRTKHMACSGAGVGVICHYWYKVLDRYMPGYSLRLVLKKIVIDQIIGSPLCISSFFISCAILEGSTKEELMREIEDKYLRLYAAEWMIWPPAQFINFYLLSTRFRVLFDNTVSLGYDVYTSKVKHTKQSRTDSS